MKIRSLFLTLCMGLLSLLLFDPGAGIMVAAADETVAADTDIRHSAINRVRAGERIEVVARVRDPEGVDVVRTYFKARDAANFSFVSMELQRRDRFTGLLPAPANDAGWVDYLILVKNGADQVVNTQTFRIEVQESDQVETYDTPVQVQTELAEAPDMVAGFQDNMVIDLVESAFRYGYVAGITDALAAGGTTAGGGATSAGTVAASGGGIGVTAAVVGGVAVVGGAAAASQGGGGSSGSSGSAAPEPPPAPEPPSLSNELEGTWNYVHSYPDACPGEVASGSFEMTCANGLVTPGGAITGTGIGLRPDLGSPPTFSCFPEGFASDGGHTFVFAPCNCADGFDVTDVFTAPPSTRSVTSCSSSSFVIEGTERGQTTRTIYTR